MSVEKLWDELWIAEKFQSNTEIAGSPRNSFRASLKKISIDGRALVGLGAVLVTEPCQTTNGYTLTLGVRLRVIRSVVKRETAQTIS